MNRRDFLLATGAAATIGGATERPAQAAVSSYAEQHPDMLIGYMAAKLNALAAEWNLKRERIRTPAQIDERNRFVREKFREMIHGYPERTPLSPVVVATHQREGYRVENVMFQSRPNFWVTGNLYVPSTGAPPYPAVLSPCGHYPLARMEPEYQCVYINLVKAGFVVLAYDPVGQGERRQYWNPQTNQTEVASSSTYEHSMPGQVLLLMAEDLTHYRIWDGIRGIDYLESLSEVDPKRIACAGHSGGGTLTLFISALDERVQCAVVNEGGTVNRWPIHLDPQARLGPSDVEQNLFPAAKWGIDMPDLHVAIAPRPLLALIEDYNPRFNAAADFVRRRYEQLGFANRFATEQANDPHSWTPKLRVATTKWLSHWLYGRPGPDREPEFQLEEPATLYCTPNGSLRYSQQGDSIFSLILKKQTNLPPRAELSPAQLASELQALLRIRKNDSPLNPRVRVTTPRKGYSVEQAEFMSEPGIYVPAWIFVPEGGGAPRTTVLAINDAGKQADGMEFGSHEKMAREGTLVIACDVRGIGQTRPPHPPPGEPATQFRQLFDPETAATYMAWFMDEDLCGMRVGDVLRSVDYALSRADVDRTRLRLWGKGAGATWVLMAAALDLRLTDVTCERGLLSYRALAQVDRYTISSGLFVRDILTKIDLPQIAASLAGRNLTLVSPVDAMNRSVARAAANHEYAPAAVAFARGGGQFRIT
jgi:cephalosporin-C deacetylase-like acetyl esterase